MSEVKRKREGGSFGTRKERGKERNRLMAVRRERGVGFLGRKRKEREIFGGKGGREVREEWIFGDIKRVWDFW